jgi:hypothetical protein
LPDWNYQGNPKTSFYSSRVSGVQRLTNGNTLICEGNKGNFIEVTGNNKIVWQYENPINNFGAIAQGETPVNNDVFKISKYLTSYSGFKDKVLSPLKTLEENPSDYSCEKLSSLSTKEKTTFMVYPNPATDYLIIQNDVYHDIKYTVTDILGRRVLSGITNNDKIDIIDLPSGKYILNFLNASTKVYYNFTFLKE